MKMNNNMDFDNKIIQEKSVRINVQLKEVVSKDMEVFYNPVMEFNRTISIGLLNAIDKKEMKIALPLSGTGIRAVRFLKELDNNKISKILINDLSKKAVKSIKENLELNNIKDKYDLFNHEATYFLKITGLYDYIDIDPFGSPNYFLDQAIKSLRRKAILAVTATDTAPLCGTYPKACKRKYWANPLRNELMHEVGLRILIRKIQLIGAQYDKALYPILSYSKDHYFRIFLVNREGKKHVDEMLKKHKNIRHSDFEIEISLGEIGPLWTGELYNYELIKKINKDIFSKNSDIKFIETLTNEAKFETYVNKIGFYDIHKIAKKYKIEIPRKKHIEEILNKKHTKFTWVHYNPNGIRTEINFNEFLIVIKELSNQKNNL